MCVRARIRTSECACECSILCVFELVCEDTHTHLLMSSLIENHVFIVCDFVIQGLCGVFVFIQVCVLASLNVCALLMYSFMIVLKCCAPHFIFSEYDLFSSHSVLKELPAQLPYKIFLLLSPLQTRCACEDTCTHAIRKTSIP